MSLYQWGVLGCFIALCLLVGAAAGAVTAQSVTEWYPALNKPSWTPPAWLFGPVWTALYLAMAIAAWLVWRVDGIRTPLATFFIQLGLNFLWSFLFFGMRSPALALIDIVLLLIAIAATAYLFSQKQKIAGVLMLPYLAWVTFATALNFAIWQMN